MIEREPVTTATLDALLDVCAFGDGQRRQQARHALVRALRQDGHKAGTARKLIDVWTAERRQARKRTRTDSGCHTPTVTAHQQQAHGTEAQRIASQRTVIQARAENAQATVTDGNARADADFQRSDRGKIDHNRFGAKSA